MHLTPNVVLGTGVLLILSGALLIALSFSPVANSPPIYRDSTVFVESNSDKKVDLGLILKDHTVIVKFTVYSPSPEIIASMNDSSGNMILAPTLINESYSFVFQNPKDEFYQLFLDNTNSSVGNFSAAYNKNVLWQVTYYGSYSLVFQISSSIPLTSGIVCIGVYLSKAKEKGRTDRTIPDLAEEIIKKIIRGAKTVGTDLQCLASFLLTNLSYSPGNMI